MAGIDIKIDSILGGISPTENFSGPGQFESSIGIDPMMPFSDTGVRSSGGLRPTVMTKFSSTDITGYPLWLLTNPKDSKIYTYQSNGKVTSYSSALASETAVGTPTSGAGNGAEYYDNYLYFATPTNVSRYGPLDGTPAIVNTYWTVTLGKTALVNTTYPALNGVTLPNHPMHYHAPTHALYFGDVVGGKGTINYIKTSKTTVEGDTDNGSTYQALTTTPYGYLPTCFESYGSDLVTGWIQGTNTTTLGKNAVITFWDTSATAPNKTIDREMPDPWVTAMKNVNGNLFVWLGNPQGGCRLIKFVGGYSWQEVGFWEDAYPPLPGAVDHWLNRVTFGTRTTHPEASASVYTVGYKIGELNNLYQIPPKHNILKTTSAGANPMCTALKHVLQADNKIRMPIVAWKDDTTQGIDKVTTGGGTSVWRSQVYRIGQPFQITKLRIPLAQAMAANMIITPTFYIDERATSAAGQTINFTNYANSERNITQKLTNVRGKHSFQLELRWTGSVLCSVALPITIEGEYIADQNG